MNKKRFSKITYLSIVAGVSLFSGCQGARPDPAPPFEALMVTEQVYRDWAKTEDVSPVMTGQRKIASTTEISVEMPTANKNQDDTYVLQSIDGDSTLYQTRPEDKKTEHVSILDSLGV